MKLAVIIELQYYELYEPTLCGTKSLTQSQSCCLLSYSTARVILGQVQSICHLWELNPTRVESLRQRLSLQFHIRFNSQGHIETVPQHCHLWESNKHSGDSVW